MMDGAVIILKENKVGHRVSNGKIWLMDHHPTNGHVWVCYFPLWHEFKATFKMELPEIKKFFSEMFDRHFGWKKTTPNFMKNDL